MEDIMKLCPFCGEKPILMEWHGKNDNRYVQKVGCGNKYCFLERIYTPVEKWQQRKGEGKL